MFLWLSSCAVFFGLAGKPFSGQAQTFSSRSGWGSIPYNGGCTFRVWAPNASKVTVAGQFNTNSTTANPLVHDPVYTQGSSWVWSVDVPGATAGQQYKYYLNGTTYKQDPRGRQEVSETGNTYIYNTTNFSWTGDTFVTPALSNVVVYELHCGSFYDPNGSGPGTFYNATNKLAQLQQLGINAVEVMPIAEFPGNNSWGYNPDDIFGVESSYGGPDAFKAFVKTAHQLGIAVLVDVVHNHYGPNNLDLWDYDGYTGGLNGGGIYFNPTNGWCCTSYGPRPNAHMPQVRSFIQDSIAMWLSECHVDGFRWDDPYDWMNASDAGTNIFIADAQSLIQQISSMVHTAYMGKINIGETSGYLSGVSGFDAVWYSSPFQGNVVGTVTATNDSARSMPSIDQAVNANHNGSGSSGWGNVYFTDTHDSAGDLNGSSHQRLPVLIDSANPTGLYARKLSTMGAAITLTSAGIPMILQGAEMFTTAQFSSSNPLNWSFTNTFSGIVSFYSDLIHLRRNSNGRSSGLEGLNTQTIQDDNSNKIIAYRRYSTGRVGDDVIVICNFANTSWPAYNISGFPHTNVWYTQLSSDWTKYGSDYGNYGSSATTVSVGSTTATISIAPYSVLILSQNIPGAPPTPQGLTATTGGTNRINLAWIPTGGVIGYIVKRDGTQIATTTTNVYADTGLSVGVQYCYSIDATNIGGVSADSDSACATTLPATTATNLLAYWTLDEGNGTIANDSSGNTNTGTVVYGDNGGGWTSSGMVNGAINFNGDGTQVIVSNSASLNPVNGITVAAWIQNNNGFYAGERILEKGKTNDQYTLYVPSDYQLAFLLAGVSNGTIVATAPSPGGWHHVAASYDGSSLMSLYIDGQLAAQQAASGSMPINTEPLVVGAAPSGNGTTFFNYGPIDDVRIYGNALAPSEISQIYNFDSVGDGIPDWWRLQYFGYSSYTDNTSCAACDVYGTGQNNYFKYVAGLNPTDPTQIFMVQIAASNEFMNLTFSPIVDGISYTVLSSPDLLNYSALTSNSAPQIDGNMETITDFSPWPSNEFYRIQITPP